MLTSCGSGAAALRGAFAVEVPVALRACAEQSPSSYLSPHRGCWHAFQTQGHSSTDPVGFLGRQASARLDVLVARGIVLRVTPAAAYHWLVLHRVAPHNTLLGTQRCWTVIVKSGMCTSNVLPRWCLTGRARAATAHTRCCLRCAHRDRSACACGGKAPLAAAGGDADVSRAIQNRLVDTALGTAA